MDTQLFEASLLLRDGSIRRVVFSRMLSEGDVVCFTTESGVETFSPNEIDLIDLRLKPDAAGGLSFVESL